MIRDEKELVLLRALADAAQSPTCFGHEWKCDCANCFAQFSAVQRAGLDYHEWLRLEKEEQREN